MKRQIGALGLFFLSSLTFLNVLADEPSSRETIFDRMVNIPDEYVLNIPYLPPLCDQMTGVKKGFVEIEGGKIYYEEEGKGTPLVLLNPGPGGTHHFFHPYFSNLKNDARVLYYDARGTGQSSWDKTGKTYTIKQAIEDLEMFRKALHIERWTVLGWSFGGFLAQVYALTHPEHVIGLILVAPSDGLQQVNREPDRRDLFLSQEEKEAILKVWSTLEEGNLTWVQAGYNADLCGSWKSQGYYKPTQEERIRSALYDWVAAPGYNCLMSFDAQEIALDGLFHDGQIPTLITLGRWDLSWGEDKISLMQKSHPLARVEVFEKSGHTIFADEEEKFFLVVREFLSRAQKDDRILKTRKEIAWPKPLPDFFRKLTIARDMFEDKEERKKLALEVYQEVNQASNKDPDVWIHLVCHFILLKQEPEKCLNALVHAESLLREKEPEYWKNDGFWLKAWQGHMLDLLGRRGEAVSCYEEALRAHDGQNETVFVGNLAIDQKWLKARLVTPFTWQAQHDAR